MLLFTIKHLQSHAFLQTYNAILPTSLISLRFSTRGYSPWRPAAVISTIVLEKHNTNSLFMILSFILMHSHQRQHQQQHTNKIDTTTKGTILQESVLLRQMTYFQRTSPKQNPLKRKDNSSQMNNNTHERIFCHQFYIFAIVLPLSTKTRSQRQFQNIN